FAHHRLEGAELELEPVKVLIAGLSRGTVAKRLQSGSLMPGGAEQHEHQRDLPSFDYICKRSTHRGLQIPAGISDAAIVGKHRMAACRPVKKSGHAASEHVCLVKLSIAPVGCGMRR